MTNPKIRKILVTLHLLMAGFLTPAFLLVAISGGNYLLDNKGSFEKTAIVLPEDSALDFRSETLQSDVENLLAQNQIDYDFDYIRNRGTRLDLRPTSRRYIELIGGDDGSVSANWVQPSLQAGLMELHKGHGPKMFRAYQMVVALGLIGVVFGGFFVGLLAPAYRRRTLIATGLGALFFLFLAFIS